jgi:hypothetical protein
MAIEPSKFLFNFREKPIFFTSSIPFIVPMFEGKEGVGVEVLVPFYHNDKERMKGL